MGLKVSAVYQVCLTLIVCLCGTLPASAVTIDFDDLTLGPVAGDVLVINAGGVDITFSGAELLVHKIDSGVFEGTYPGTGNQLTSGGFFGPLFVDVEPGFVFDFVQIENHITSEFETDIIVGRAFDADGLLVDSFTSGLELASLTGPGIVSVSFEAPETAFLIDNFTFTATPVPEPSVALLMGLGLAALAARRND